LAGLSGFSAVVGLLGYLSLANTLNEYLALISTLVVFVGASLAWKHGFVPARWYLLGHLMLFVSVAVVVFTGWGYLRWPFVSDNGLQTGVAIEVMVFAVALSSRIRLMQSVQAELKVRTEQLTVASETDPLTGAANRAGLAQQASQVLTHPNQRTLILLDLDKFKPVNDLYGHEAGDAVLVEIARRIKALLRADDMVARVGGDEFVVLLNQANDRAVLDHISKRLLDSIAQPVAFGGQMLTVGGSLGIARYPGNGLTLPDLMQAADVAMYHIKKNGRAGYAFFDDVPSPPVAPVSG
jgi:diguanylate cyclase (GGDEF)-like protein